MGKHAALEADARLGVLHDVDLALAYNVWPSAVRRARVKLGKPAPFRRIHDWSDCDMRRPTAVIAAEKNCSESTVCNARRRMGVKEYERTRCARKSYEGAGRSPSAAMAKAEARARQLVASGATKCAASRIAGSEFGVNWRSVQDRFRARKTRHR